MSSVRHSCPPARRCGPNCPHPHLVVFEEDFLRQRSATDQCTLSPQCIFGAVFEVHGFHHLLVTDDLCRATHALSERPERGLGESFRRIVRAATRRKGPTSPTAGFQDTSPRKGEIRGGRKQEGHGGHCGLDGFLAKHLAKVIWGPSPGLCQLFHVDAPVVVQVELFECCPNDIFLASARLMPVLYY